MAVIMRAVISITAVIFFLAGNAVAQKADPAVYGALPDVTEAQISPDGSTVALLHNVEGESAVLFYDLDNPGAVPTGIRVDGANARDIEWADNEYLLLLVSQSARVETSSKISTLEFFRWASISKSKAVAEILFGNETGYYLGSAGSLLSVLPDRPGKALFSRFSTRGQGPSGSLAYSIFSVDLNNGRLSLAATGAGNTVDWIINVAGDPIVRIDYDDDAEKRNILVKREGATDYSLLRSLPEPRGTGAKISLYGFSPSRSNMLYATATRLDGKRSLYEFSLDTGRLGEKLFSHPDYDLDSIAYDPRTATVSRVNFVDDMPRAFHLNEDDRKLQKSLERVLPGSAPMIVSKSANGNRIIVEAIYADHPKQYFLYDTAARRLDMFAASYRALDGKVVAKKEKYDYAASDGLTIPGYLTVPTNASKSSMPLIVLPHGGPWVRDDQSFDWWPFFYAARGYLVYQPNFRGSAGYGAAFKAAGYNEWGRRMQDDITQGVDKLIHDGVVDPSRVCIVGASYGGYAALAGATLTPDLYQCAVSVNGVTNLPGMLGDEKRESEWLGDYWEKRIGKRYKDEKKLRAVSPRYQVEHTGPPILLIHSKHDTVVPIGQSRQMRDALKHAGKAYEYIELDGEDHWLSTGQMRTQMLRASIEFIDRHIGQ